MNRKAVNAYVTYTTKKPILFIAVVFFGLFFIFYMTLTIKTNIIKTYDGTISQVAVNIPAGVSKVPGRVYLYKDRNEAIYPVKVVRVEYKADITALYVETFSQEISFTDSPHIKVDIPMQQITLFERVFLKGGKVSNE